MQLYEHSGQHTAFFLRSCDEKVTCLLKQGLIHFTFFHSILRLITINDPGSFWQLS